MFHESNVCQSAFLYQFVCLDVSLVVIAVRFEDCIAEGNAIGGYTFQGIHGNTSGTVDIVGGSVRDQSSPGLIFFDKHPRVVVTLSHVSISNVANQGPGEGEDPLEGWWLRTPIVIQSYPAGGQKSCCHHPWKHFPFGGLVFGKGVEISHSRTNRSSRQQHWPWLRAYHIDARPMAGSANWTDPGNANITGTVRVFTSTPEAVCPGVSIDDHGPQNNVSIKVLCNSDLDAQQDATTIKTDDSCHNSRLPLSQAPPPPAA